jgi:hypothetical protein
MALKTERQVETRPPSDTAVLELALYKKYTWGTTTYEAGKPYRFRHQDAMVLLSEQDTGRPIWRLYTPERPKVVPSNEPQDKTWVQALPPVENLSVTPPPAKRIEIGDDSEIADILQTTSEGDVTV